MAEFDITGLHHIQLAIPVSGEDAARAFYVGRLGLTEVSKPAALAGRGGIWLAGQGGNLHLGVDAPFHPATKAHPAFAVPDLAAARATLADLDPTEITALPGLTRFYIADPFGNRIEIVETG